MAHDPKDPPTDEAEDVQDFGFAAFGGDDSTGFNYSAFEEKIQQAADAETEDQATDPGMVDAQVEARPTIDLRQIPQDAATYDLRELGRFTVVTIRGRINESFPGEQIGEKLKGSVIFDLTEIDRITSFGVRAWLQMLDSASLSNAYFLRASPAVVNQVTMMRNFCGPARIHSLVAPYACEACGNEFGVTYHAVQDRAALRARNPLTIECPSCRSGAELDEDPWVFFGIDDQLLEEVPDDLQKVLEHLGDRPTHAPIEKAIVGDTTRIRFNGVINGSTRFQRAFSGLEGPIVVDLRTASSIDDDGAEGLREHLARLDDAITHATIEGCPVALVRALLDRPDPRLSVHSVATVVSSPSRGLERPVMVDLRRHRAALLAGQVPDLDVPWRDERVELHHLELLGRATALVREEAPRQPAVQAVAVAPAPSVGMMLPAMGLAALLGVAVIAVVIALVFLRGGPPAAGPSDVAAQMPTPAAVAANEWSTGGAVPPAWAERAAVEEPDRVLLAGVARGDSSVVALEEARRVALQALLTLAAKNLEARSEADRLPADGALRAEAEERWALQARALPLEREKDASRVASDGTTEVAVQYSLRRDVFESFLAPYRSTASFRGLTVAPRTPWQPPGLRVVERASYVPSAEVGDLVVQVGGRAVATPEDFERLANERFNALAEGQSFQITLARGDDTVQVPFARPRRAPEIQRSVPELQMPGR